MQKPKTRHKIISALTDINVIGIRALVNKLPKLLIAAPKGKVTISTIYGFLMEIDPIQDRGVEKSIYYTGTYEKGTMHMLQNILKKGDIFVDVGANIGLMSIYASLLVKDSGKVFAFEPNPATNEILKKNIGLNSIQNIEVSDYGIGSVTETNTIYDRWDSGRGSASMIEPDFETDSHSVNITTLTDYFSEKVQKIDLVKIDIEGYELEALKGAAKLIETMYPALIIEVSDARTNFEGASGLDIYNFLRGFDNYRMFKLLGSKKRATKLTEINSEEEIPEHDNIFCLTSDHIQRIPSSVFK